MDVVIISPEPGKQVEIGKKLLALAEHPHQVQWVTYPQAGFQIPLQLLFRFEEATIEDPEPMQAAEPEPRRRRGRPRKEEDTDNNTSEEE